MELLIDAIEQDIDGVEYFMEKAREFLKTKMGYSKQIALSSLAESIARGNISDYILKGQELEHIIDEVCRDFESINSGFSVI